MRNIPYYLIVGAIIMALVALAVTIPFALLYWAWNVVAPLLGWPEIALWPHAVTIVVIAEMILGVVRRR